ncbi:MAG: hypothetical protein GY705_21825, partial [Bacteroidetes bacterium]|nr:hypothetical protein [Bacteroidota bacterium]
MILLFLVISTLTITDVSLAGNYSDDWPTGGIVWDHTDVSGWAVTSNLSSVVVSGGGITYNHDKSCSWPMYDRSVNANAWVIHKNSDGRWHANTWDFMRKCQISKDSSHVGWGGGRPKAGQT